jgi:hypothetical protein
MYENYSQLIYLLPGQHMQPHAERAILAESPTCRIEQCACGVIHLTLGVVTLRLSPAALEELALVSRKSLRGIQDPHPVASLHSSHHFDA